MVTVAISVRGQAIMVSGGGQHSPIHTPASAVQANCLGVFKGFRNELVVLPVTRLSAEPPLSSQS